MNTTYRIVIVDDDETLIEVGPLDRQTADQLAEFLRSRECEVYLYQRASEWGDWTFAA